MAEKIPQHVHCNLCWKAIPVGEKFCSDDCKQKYQAMKKKGRILLYFLIIVFVAVLIMNVVL